MTKKTKQRKKYEWSVFVAKSQATQLRREQLNAITGYKRELEKASEDGNKTQQG